MTTATAADPLGPPGNPNGRLYEQVSPPDKNGFDALGFQSGVNTLPAVFATGYLVPNFEGQSSQSGDAFYFRSLGAFADADAQIFPGPHYVVTRTATGWSTHSITPPYANLEGETDLFGYFPSGFSGDMRYAVVSNSNKQPPLSGDAVEGQYQIYRRDNETDTYQVLTKWSPLASASTQARYADASDDYSHVSFRVSSASLDPGDPLNALYEGYIDDNGDSQVRIASVVGGAPVAGWAGGAMGGGGTQVDKPVENSVSNDGSRIVFNDSTAGCNTMNSSSSRLPAFNCNNNHIYLRENGSTTREVSAPAPGTPPDPAPGPGLMYWTASNDTTKIFFTAQRKLTSDSTASTDSSISTGSFGDLYRYDTAANGGAGELVDITVDPVATGGARVLGVLGASDDGERIYFVARSNQLDGGQGVDGQANLYLWDGNGGNPRTRYIATLQPRTGNSFGSWGDSANWLSWSAARTSATTSDGARLVFGSKNQLTAFPNAGRNQIYVYDALTETLECASCAGSGPATGDAFLRGPAQVNSLTRDRRVRTISDDGRRVFFNSFERLVPEDANTHADVYEYDVDLDRLALISNGRGTEDSFLIDSSANGRDVFFMTRERLVGWDVDANVDVYDARIGGGFPEPVSETPCVDDGCQAPPSAPPTDAAPGSVAFAGSQAGRAARARLSLARISRAQQRRLARTGAIRLRVRVSNAGRIVVDSNRGHRVAVRAKGAGVKRVALRLSRQSRLALAAGRRLKVRVVVRFGGAKRTAVLVLRRTK